MLLVVLAGIWGAVLVSFLRGRAEERPADSIGTFRRQLNVLQRTAPAVVAPANRLRPSLPQPAAVIGPARPVYARSVSPEALRRRHVQKRRRDVFLTLLAGIAVTFVLGLVPALRVLWKFNVALDVLFVVYVGLLMRMRAVAAEREMKVRFLPHTGAPEPALLFRQSAN